MSAPAIVVDQLRKEFRSRRKSGLLQSMQSLWKRQRADTPPPVVAVDGITFSVDRGEVFGLLGPNGAGKTTTIKMISTLLRPTSGRVAVLGRDVGRESTRVLANLGTVLSGERCVYWKLTGRENLQYFGALYGLRGPSLRRKIDALLDRFQLTHRADETVEKYSTGMKRRIALARALLHEPRVLILDEPTAGLDPQGARNLRELILDLKREGKTVLLTTHYMEEADYLSDRVAIIDHGRIIALDPPGELKRQLNSTRVIQLDALEWRDEVGESLKACGLVSSYVASHGAADGTWTITAHLSPGVSVGSVMTAYLDRGNSIQNLSVKEPTLEDVFIQLTGKSLRD